MCYKACFIEECCQTAFKYSFFPTFFFNCRLVKVQILTDSISEMAGKKKGQKMWTYVTVENQLPVTFLSRHAVSYHNTSLETDAKLEII